MTTEPWESELAELFPGYLLPAAEQVAQSPEVAATFLERLSGNPGQLRLVRIASVLHRHQVALEDFALRELPALVRVLPSWTEVERRDWEGHFHGRLDVAATLSWDLRGQPQHFVTRTRHRRFDRPENVLVRTVADRLLALLTELLQDFRDEDGGWVGRMREAAESLRHLLLGTVLREVPAGPLDDHHVNAARMAIQAAYGSAADWAGWLVDELEETEPTRVARLVAEAALLPVSLDTRFELAVLLRLARSIEAWLVARGPGWRCERSCVLPDRTDVVRFVRGADDIRLCYNVSVQGPTGPRAEALRHYFGHTGRQRPDVTVEVWRGGRVRRVLIEIKRTMDPSYAISGFDEARIYAWEHARWLTGWPKAVLVTTCPVVGSARVGDDVVAISWGQWVPDLVLDGLLGSLVATPDPSPSEPYVS
ncbi:MAG: hypothetical protein ABMA64_00235 [Myxococcota bacterium]